jgi:hypothetical protein
MDMYGPFFEERRLNYSNLKGLERFHPNFHPGQYLPWPAHFYNQIEDQYPYFLTAFGKLYPWPEVSPIFGCDKELFYNRPYGNLGCPVVIPPVIPPTDSIIFLITENGDRRVTEDGQPRVTEDFTCNLN